MKYNCVREQNNTSVAVSYNALIFLILPGELALLWSFYMEVRLDSVI